LPAGPAFPIHLPVSFPINPITVELGVTVPVMGMTPPERLLGVDLTANLLDRLNAASVAVIIERPDHVRFGRQP
jgi:hypothetical protein